MLTTRLPEAGRVEYLEVPVPEISDDQVLLKNINLGVCASDLQVFHGKHQYVKFPLTLGHEVSSEIVKVGKNVRDFKVGDRVALQPQLVCGECYNCKTGRYNVCNTKKTIGIHVDGCACEYFAADPWNLHKIPDGMAMDVAALVEPMAVGVGSVKRSRDYKGANIVVLGAGTIGNLTAQAAKAMGAEKVMITDILDSKLKIAEECGIDYTVNTADRDLSKAIDEAFGSYRRADIIIDCAATRGTFQSALDVSRNNSIIVISGNFKAPVEFNVPVMQRRELTLIGHMMYVKEDFQQALDLLSEGKIAYEKIISRHFPIREYEKAFEFIDANPELSMKVMIDIA